MKVYTEVVYTWDDNKGELVEESSKSFDYEGEVTQCNRKRYPHYHPPAFKPPKIVIPTFKPPKPPKIVLPPIKLPDVVTEGLTNLNTTLSGAGSTLQTNLEGAASGVSEGLKTGTSAVRAGVHAAASATSTNLATGADAGKAFLHEGADLFKAGMQKLGLHKKDDPGSDTTVGSTSAPGQALTMGQGGQGGMKGASLSYVKKKTVGSGGKRRLTKIKKKGSTGARV
jgi:hypothetical protein